MRSAATYMPWWQVHLIDVYALIFAVLFAVLYIEWKLIKWCCCRNTKQASPSTSRAKRNKNVKAKMQ
jgi:UDP-glucoronosyl and UDP-glucosyl transferase